MRGRAEEEFDDLLSSRRQSVARDVGLLCSVGKSSVLEPRGTGILGDFGTDGILLNGSSSLLSVLLTRRM